VIASVLYTPGGHENFKIETPPIPETANGQVLVRVKALGLNRSELITTKGYFPKIRFPRVMGIKYVGKVVNEPSGDISKVRKWLLF
jgi:NADPH:quinone reductase